MKGPQIFLTALVLILAASVAPTPASSFTPAFSANPLSAPAASPSPVPPAAKQSPRATAPVAVSQFDIGVPAGNAYYPSSLALDDARNLAYVFHSGSDKGPSTIAVVDLAGGKVARLIPLTLRPLGSSSRLFLAGEDRQLILYENGGRTQWVVDTQTGTVKPVLDLVRDIAISEDGKLLFAARDSGLAAYPVESVLSGRPAPIWHSKASYDRLAANGGRLLAASYATGSPLSVFDARTGASIATASLPEGAVAVSPGPAGGWAVVVGGDPRLIRYGPALEQLGETPIPYAHDLSYDARDNRFLLGGMRTEGNGVSARSVSVVLAIDGSDGRVTRETRWPGLNPPTAFAPWGEDALLAFPIGGPALLSILDASALEPRSAIPMGVRVVDALVDGARLYVADDLGRIHVLKLPGGEEVALWQGSEPMALDKANQRLYANRADRVVALSLGDGSVVAEFPQGGYPAPDPNRDLVYIADRGVTMYDRSGKKLGDLPSTFPDPKGLSPNPYAYAAQVNPVTGHVAVILHNGVPGSNGGSFLRIYEPQRDKFTAPPARHSFIMDVLSDSKGNWYVAYSPARGQEAVQVLSPDGKELRRLDHRTGFLALDEQADDLYLLGDGRATRLAASALTPLEALAGPGHVGGLAVAPAAAVAYVFDRGGPVLSAVDLAALPPLNLKPAAARVQPDAYNLGLAITSSGKKRILVGQFDKTFRSSDGKAWQQLLPGLELTVSNITAVDGGTVFVTGRSAFGGEGAWRSKDGGDTWEWLTGGLTDLASEGPVLARSADDAYFYSRGQGLLRWDPAARRWQLASALKEGEDWSSLALAADGVLFRSRAGNLERSDDRGVTWTALAPTSQAGDVIGFSALYTVTQTIFSGLRADYRVSAIQRSNDGGKTWQPTLTSAQVDLDGPLRMVSGFGRTYLLTQPYQGKPALLRTTDDGDTWQVAPAETAAGVTAIAVDPLDGRLWLGERGGVRAVAPDKLRWQPLKPAVATPVPTPAATPTAGPCANPLSPAEAEINARSLGIGCPRGPIETVQMARQRLQGGQMVWRADRRQIYVIYNDGHWEQFDDKWVEGDPAEDPTLTPPADLYQATRGFGKVWRENLSGPGGQLGWALEKEQGVLAQAQDWEHGTLLRFGGEVIVLGDAGRWW